MSVIIQRFNVIVKALTRHSYAILLKRVAPQPLNEPKATYTVAPVPMLNPQEIQPSAEHAELLKHVI
jgi:hypothetical protein